MLDALRLCVKPLLRAVGSKAFTPVALRRSKRKEKKISSGGF